MFLHVALSKFVPIHTHPSPRGISFVADAGSKHGRLSLIVHGTLSFSKVGSITSLAELKWYLHMWCCEALINCVDSCLC